MIKSFSLISFLLPLFIFHPLPAQDIRSKEKQLMKQYDLIEYNDVGKITNMDDIRQMIHKSKEINFRSGELRGLILLQRNALRRGNYSLSEKYGDEAEKLAQEENDNYSLSLIHLNKACAAVDLGLQPEARMLLEDTTYADRIENKTDKDLYYANAYMLLAGVFSRINAKDSMVYYTQKSLNRLKSIPSSGLTAYQEIRCYYLTIFQLMNMGIAYAYHPQKPRPGLAEKYFQKALGYSVTHPQYFKLCDIEVYEAVSYFYFTQKDYHKSIGYSRKVLELEKVKKKPQERLSAYDIIKDSYNALGNSEEELTYLKLYTHLNDSINKVQNISVINQSRKKINTFRDVYSRNRLAIIITAAVIIFMIIAVSWKYNKKRADEYRKKYNELIHELYQNNPGPEDENKDHLTTCISSETEKRILKKLETFENSEKFLKKGINIAYLSNLLSTNPKYLSEVIRNNKSQNFNAYINSLRINYIVHNLYNDPKYREYKISYLAEECGYASSQVFVIAFKKEKGVTPSYFINELNSHHSAASDI
ncbi:helix-turn-helix domain-containing protein [Chryseobacterium arthrosphaerae]|uniref:helix-turn-helix domain-containing protein n=1 Tax=Chryseobacterium arthrosphaerae TaxID=651561 RepID=UPI003D33A347